MSTRQYDEVGEAFEGFKALPLPLAHCAKVPSFLAMVGDVRDRSVLAQSPDFRFDSPSPSLYGFLSELTGEETGTGPRVRVQ